MKNFSVLDTGSYLRCGGTTDRQEAQQGAAVGQRSNRRFAAMVLQGSGQGAAPTRVCEGRFAKQVTSSVKFSCSEA